MTARRPVAADLRQPVMALALGFGAGLAPRAPGTAGTLVGVALFPLLAPLPPAYYAAVVALLFVAGIPVCAAAARRLGAHDHPGIVWDEVVGYLVAMAALPATWPWMAAGFAAFRLFDIAKPWPIGVLDRRLGGGLGIMLDDLLAGLMALALLHGAAAVFG